jgi:hypothetical protein
MKNLCLCCRICIVWTPFYSVWLKAYPWVLHPSSMDTTDRISSTPNTVCPRPMCPRMKVFKCFVPWTMRPLYAASLIQCVPDPDRFVPTLDHIQAVSYFYSYSQKLRAIQGKPSFAHQKPHTAPEMPGPGLYSPNLSYPNTTSGKGWIIRDCNVQGTHQRDGTSENFPFGTHRSRMNLHCTKIGSSLMFGYKFLYFYTWETQDFFFYFPAFSYSLVLIHF